MAALMRSARFCSPAIQIPKLLRVACCGTSQRTAGYPFKKTYEIDQRSWRSTLAEDMETPLPTSTKLETMMNSLDRYVRQFGRVSRKQLDPVVSCLDKEGSISVSNSLSLLRMYGSALFDEPPANRLKLAEELWEKYKKHGIPLEAMHYNTLLAVYNMNKLQFSPTEFLANMEANGVTPNRVTYQRLIARFCEVGDIQGATQVLEHMKSASMPISDQVFNSFIIAHLRCNDPDSARNILDVMRQTGLEPTSMTYTVLAMGFAERGEMEEVKKYLSQAEIENMPLRPGQLLDVYMALAVAGHSQHLPELFPYLHAGTPFNQDAIKACNQLIAAGHDDAAYQLFLEMPKPSRMGAEQTTLGRFFLRALARHQRPVEKVMEVVKDMQTREVNRDDISAVAHLAYLEGQPAYAMAVLEKMQEEGVAVRAHYFWPAMCQFRDAGNKQGIYEVMGQMTSSGYSQEDLVHTLYMYTIPALLTSGESQSDIIHNLQNCNLETKDIHFAMFLCLLDGHKLQEALDFLEGHEMSVNMVLVRACLLNMPNKGTEWKIMLEILRKLKTQSATWGLPALESTVTILRQVLMDQRKAEWADAQDIFSFMQANDLKISRRGQKEMAEYFAGAPPEILQGLKELMSTVGLTTTAAEREGEEGLFQDKSLEQLQQLAKEKPKNKAVLKRLLIKACAVGNVEEAERVQNQLEGEGFVFPPIMLSQLAFLYATFVQDLPKATTYLQQVEERFPEFSSYLTVVLKIAALQAASGDTEGAVDRLKSYANKHEEVVKRLEIKREDNYSKILQSAVDVEAARRLMTTLTECGYLPADSMLLLDSFMEKVLDSGDTEVILKEFEEIVKTHKCSPQVDKVLQFFIHKEDADSVQKVVDLLTEIHGLTNVLHHLIADFIECGHLKKARKIVETPGLRANMQRLSYYCRSFVDRNMIKEMEMLVEVTKDMFAIDRDLMFFHLIRGYVKQKEMEKAKDVLLQYEEEMLQPSARTLRFLARSLEAAGLPVPFEVPEFQPVTEPPRRTRRGDNKGDTAADTEVENVAMTNTAASQLKEDMEKGDLQQVMTALKSDKSLLSQAISLMKKPWPAQALQSLFESLAQQGDVDTLNAVNDMRLPATLRNTLKEQLFLAAVDSGRGQEVIDKMETTTSNSARYLTFPVLDRLSHAAPQLMDRVESMARKFLTEKNYSEPLSILWCYYKFHNLPRADQIMQEIPDFDKNVLTGTLCQAAVKENKVEVLESLLKMKQDTGEKRGMAVAYSALLQLYAGQQDVEGVQKTCDRLLAEGLLKSSLRQYAVKAAEALLTERNQPMPAWGDEASSESSSDSSSSDEEKLSPQS